MASLDTAQLLNNALNTLTEQMDASLRDRQRDLVTRPRGMTNDRITIGMLIAQVGALTNFAGEIAVALSEHLQMKRGGGDL